MSSDIVMIALATAGIALSVAYFYVAAKIWRRQVRRLHAERLRTDSPAGHRDSPRQIAA